jgi:multidrug efflux pump subunit AcrA (membrane-fusion protein)
MPFELNGVVDGAALTKNDVDSQPIIHRSEEMGEMLERTPSWLTRWGVYSILIVLCLLIGVAMMIHYPDTLEGEAVITTNPLPIRLKPPNSGRIMHLFVGDGQHVAAATPIAEMQNNTGYLSVVTLQRLADSAALCLTAEKAAFLKALLAHPIGELGDGQAPYNALIHALNELLLFNEEHVFSRRVGNLREQMGNYKATVQVTESQAGLTQQEFNEASERFSANEKLYREKVISRQEYLDEAAKLRQKQLTVQNQAKERIQEAITYSNTNRQMLDLEYESTEKQNSLKLAAQEAIRNLQAFVQVWKLQYLLVAPYAGTVHFLRPLQVNENTVSGEELFAVIPKQYSYEAAVTLPATGLGKVKKGQAVHIQLAQFPYNEFGYLEGKVHSIATLPIAGVKGSSSEGQTTQNEPMYRVTVELPSVLKTSFKKLLPYSPEMSGKAGIITADRSLLGRLIGDVMRLRK